MEGSGRVLIKVRVLSLHFSVVTQENLNQDSWCLERVSKRGPPYKSLFRCGLANLVSVVATKDWVKRVSESAVEDLQMHAEKST
jgi:hypothetical protein